MSEIRKIPSLVISSPPLKEHKSDTLSATNRHRADFIEKLKFQKNSKSKKKSKKLIINLENCRYPLVEEVATQKFGFVVSNSSQPRDWNLLWTDTVSLLTHFFISHLFTIFGLLTSLKSSGSQKKSQDSILTKK